MKLLIPLLILPLLLGGCSWDKSLTQIEDKKLCVASNGLEYCYKFDAILENRIKNTNRIKSLEETQDLILDKMGKEIKSEELGIDNKTKKIFYKETLIDKPEDILAWLQIEACILTHDDCEKYKGRTVLKDEELKVISDIKCEIISSNSVFPDYNCNISFEEPEEIAECIQLGDRQHPDIKCKKPEEETEWEKLGWDATGTPCCICYD